MPERRPSVPEGTLWLVRGNIGRRPLYREEALCAGRFSVLRGLKEASGSICRRGG